MGDVDLDVVGETSNIYQPPNRRFRQNGRDLARMSLSSSATARLDVADLSSVWNRKSTPADIDEAISEQLREKYAMDKWLQFLDPALEMEFVEKYFYGSFKTHLAFCLITAFIYAILLLTFLLIFSFPLFIMHFVLGGVTFFVYLYGRYSKNFRDYEFALMAGLVFYHAFGVGLERQLTVNEASDYFLQINDAHSYAIFYIFVLYSGMVSLRFTSKTVAKIWVGLMVVYYAHMSFFDLTTPVQYLDNTLFFIVVSASMAFSTYSTEANYRDQDVRRVGVLLHTEEVAKEKLITEKLLLNILPTKIARRLMDHEEVIADQYDNVTVLFADLVGWTEISRSMNPIPCISLLSEIVSVFDHLSMQYGIEKIKTIGDGYLVACGLPEPLPAQESAQKMALFALDILHEMERLSKLKGRDLKVTLGIHTGAVVAGVIGKTKFLYDLWGDSVNTASRMQSHGEANKVHVTSAVEELLRDEFEFEKRPVMYVKGKGDMQTYFLVSRKIHDLMGSNNVHDGIDSTAGYSRNSQDEIHQESSPEEAKKLNGKARRELKTKEALKKKKEEMEARLESQILSSWGTLYFQDKKLEEQYRETQQIALEGYTVKFIVCFILIELVAGLDLFVFDSSNVSLYYKVVGPCVAVQFVCAVICYFAKTSSLGLSIFNLVLNRICFVVLFCYFRMQSHSGLRFAYYISCMIQVLSYNASKVPYRYVKRIEWAGGLGLVLANLFFNSKIGIDAPNMIMYLAQTLYGQETAKHVEKQSRRVFLLSNEADAEREKVLKQREESERLLHNILPDTLISRLREGSVKLVDQYEMASVLFADIVGFTVLSSKLDAPSIVKMLNSLFSQVDEVAERKGMEKIKTIGDAYMVVAGLPYPRPDHARVAVEMGLEMVKIVQNLPEISGLKVNVRIGVHSGPVVGGIIGSSKMVFDIWGKNVNIASKMESNGSPGCVNVSHVTQGLVGEVDNISFEKRDKTVTYGDQKFELFFATPKTSDDPAALIMRDLR